MKGARESSASPRWWRPPFASSPDPAVRRAWHAFATHKGGRPYTVTEAITYMERLIPQQGGGSGSVDQIGPLGIGLTRWLRELRA